MKNSRLVVAVGFTAIAFAGRALAESYALVVGVNDCPEFHLPDGSRPRPLRGAETDADVVAGLLQEDFHFSAERVHQLKGAQATRAAIVEALTDFEKRLKPADQFVFHFSGHGTQQVDSRPFEEPDGVDEALCPFDAEADGNNLLRDDDLALLLDDIPARFVTVILDCCHSGSGIKDPDDDLVARYLPLAAPRRNPRSNDQLWRDLRGTSKSLDRRLTVFYACGADQQAYERRLPGMKAPARVGQFSHFLIEGLRTGDADANRDGSISAREAFGYAARQLDESFNCYRGESKERQQPLLEADFPNAPLFNVAKFSAATRS